MTGLIGPMLFTQTFGSFIRSDAILSTQVSALPVNFPARRSS